jgi:hypothetical protein
MSSPANNRAGGELMLIPDDIQAGRKLVADALKIEPAWLDSPEATPSASRVPLPSEIDLGLIPTESQYAAGLLDRFELQGIGDALDNVIANRTTLATFRDAAVEQWEVVAHVLSR